MRPRSLSPLAIVLLAGILVRLPVVAEDFHTTADLDIFRRWARLIRDRGPTEAYRATDVNYPPLVVYGFALSGALESALPEAWRGDRALTALIKAWPLLADLGIAAVIARTLADAAPPARALAVAAYLLHPAIWYTSAHWGQLESVYTFFLLACVAALSVVRLHAAWVCFALAVMTKPHALALLPLMIVASLRLGGWRALARGTVAACGAAAVAVAPWLWTGKAWELWSDWPIAPISPLVDASAYNLWYLTSLGHVHGVSSELAPPGVPFSYRSIGAALFGALALLVGGLVWRRRALTLALPAAILGLGFYFLPTESHERFMFPALPFLLLAIFDRSTSEDRNDIAVVWGLLSLTFTFNLVTIASPAPQLWTNVVAATDATPLVSVLKALAVAAAALNLGALAHLLRLLAKR